MAVYALGDATHFGVAVPVKFEPLRHNHIEKSKFSLSLDRQGDYTMRRHDLTHNFNNLRYSDFVHLLHQEDIMWRFDKRFGEEVVMLSDDHADKVEDTFEGRRFFEDELKLFEFLGF